MKKFILNYKDFLKTIKLQEAVLTPEQDAKYSKIKVNRDVKNLHKKIFGKSERIYLPFDLSLYNIQDSRKTEIQKTIEEIFEEKGYEIVSYIQNQCKKINDKRITKIGKVLVSKEFNREALAKAYAEEVDKLRAVKDTSELLVVFSRNYDDIASMSTKKAWNSCQNLDPDSGYSQNLKNYVAKDLKEGSIIAYLIKSTDKEILDPEARILIKPFINKTSKWFDMVLLPCTKTYHRGLENNTPLAYPKFPKFVMGWCKQVQPNINGVYKMHPNVYHDGETKLDLLSKDSLEKIKNPKTIEDFEMFFLYYEVPIGKHQIEIDIDGYLIYDGNIEFDEFLRLDYENNYEYYQEMYGFDSDEGFVDNEDEYTADERYSNILKWLPYIKTIKGDLKIDSYFNTFEMFENLEVVEGDVEISSMDTESFNGLENLKRIGGYFEIVGMDIVVFKGLDNLEYIGDDFIFKNCKDLEYFDGLENLETVKGDIIFKDCENLRTFDSLSKDLKFNKIIPQEYQDLFDGYKNS